ncbi:MAG: carboxypeptidase regulatory-like domain-containing protein, partial [Acidobacteriota bacterium]
MRRDVLLRGVFGLLAMAIASIVSATTVEITGRVVDVEGEAVAGVQVLAATVPERGEYAERILAGEIPYRAVTEGQTDERGRYRLSVAPGPYSLVLHADGFRPLFSLPIPAFDATAMKTAQMSAAQSFEVRVLDPEGAPFGGAWLYFDGLRTALDAKGTGWLGEVTFGRTDDGGRARLAGGVHENRMLLVFAEGFPATSVAPADGETEVTVRLERGLAMDVETVDSSGEPIPSTWLFHQTIPWGRTDDQGQTTLYLDRRRLELGLEITALHGHFRGETTLRLPAAQIPGTAGPKAATKAVLQLAPLPTVTGTVVDALDNRPIAGAMVWSPSMAPRFAWTRADGSFEFPTSKDRLEAWAHGYGQRWLDVKDGEIHFALEPKSTGLGRVLAPDGEVVEGATVQIRSLRKRGSRVGSLPEWAKEGVTSDAEGRFRLTAPVGVSLELTATAPGYGPGYGTLSAPAITDGRGVDLRLKWERSAVGEVVDPQGEAVAEATVLLMRPVGGEDGSPPLHTKTDVDGRFELEGLGTGDYRVEVSADGFPPLAIRSLEVAEEDARIDLGRLELKAGTSLAGRVTSTDGQPLSGVTVTAVSSRRHWTSGAVFQEARASSDADGRFELRGLVPEQPYEIRGRLRGWDGEQRVTAAPEDGPVELRLERRMRVRGRVIDPKGNPIFEARVSFNRGHGGHGVVTDRDGYFEHRTAPGRYQLVASGPTHRQWLQNDVPVEPGMADLEITLEEGLSISGRVLDPSGEPLGDIRLRLKRSQSSMYRSHEPTDPQGRFVLGGLKAGPLEIEARHPTLGITAAELELTESVTDFELRFPAGAEFSGVVLDDAEGETIADVTVQLNRQSPPFSYYETTTDGEGSFQLAHVRPGSYRLKASRPGYAPKILQVEIAEEGQRDLILELASGATLTGQLVGADPSSLARLSLNSNRGDHRSTRLGEEGRYRYRHLSVGEWKLEAQLDDGRAVSQEFAVTEADRDLEINLEFEDEGLTVTGEILRGEHGVVGATVRAFRIGRFGQGPEVLTGVGGQFHIRGLEIGEYSVNVREQGKLIAFRRLEVVGDDHWRLDISGSTVGGQVIDGEGQPLNNIGVYLSPSEVSTVTLPSTPCKRYSSSHLPRCFTWKVLVPVPT